MANEENILLNPDIKQKMLMLMGEDKKSDLSKEEEKAIAKNYANMFFALATIRWCNGQTLGTARQKALEQMDNFVKSKTKESHPMNKYLTGIHNQYRRFVPELNMQNTEMSDKKIGLNPELAKKWSDAATKTFQQSLAVLNDMYKKHTVEKSVKTQPAIVKLNIAQKKAQKLLQMALLQQRANQRSA